MTTIDPISDFGISIIIKSININLKTVIAIILLKRFYCKLSLLNSGKNLIEDTYNF